MKLGLNLPTEDILIACLQAVISGLSPDNTANILGSFTVCNTTVYLVDTVLLPAATIDDIPQINVTTVTAASATVVSAPALAPKTGVLSPFLHLGLFDGVCSHVTTAVFPAISASLVSECAKQALPEFRAKVTRCTGARVDSLQS